jgi:TetR/AcrR family transcriptional regulator
MATKHASTATKRRAPGRPARTSGDQRDRLLDAAIALFSKQGVAGTPLSAIARKARVTPALVHYYFGNREQLIDALMTERIAPLIAGMAVRLAETGGEPGALVHTFVATIIRILADNPWLPPL